MEKSITRVARRSVTMSVVLTLLVACPLTLVALPGDVLDVEYEGRLTAVAVDAYAQSLFGSEDAPQSKYAVDVYWLRFETTDLDGTAAPVRAQLFVPILERPAIVPLYVFAPGSTGLVRPCRPSREHEAGIHWGLYRAHVLSHVGQGAVGLLPDYVGFEDDSRIQPYFVSLSEGRMLLDAVRAAQAYFRATPSPATPSPRAILAGYSQGGHAAFAAADLRISYAPDVQLGGLVGYGATTDIRTLFLEFVVSSPLVVYVYSQLYGEDRFDPRQVLQKRWADTLAEDVTTQCIGGIQSYYPWDPEELYTPAFLQALRTDSIDQTFPEIHRIMEQNSSGLTGHGVPALIAQGRDDIVISVESQEAFVAALCGAGSSVRYLLYEESRHDTRQIGFGEAVAWIKARASGTAAPSDCDGLLVSPP